MGMNGDFLVSITLKAVDQASGIFAKVSGEASQSENIITRNAAAMRTAGIAMTAAGGAIVGGMVAAATSAADYGSTLVDMSARTGASVESLSKLGYAAQQTGADMSTVENGLKFVSRNAVEAANGTGPAADAFKQLGISVTDASGNMKTAEELFVETGNALRNVDNDATRTALAMDIFGRSGNQLIPMFTDANKSLGEYTDEAVRFGIVISTETANKMDEFGDKLDTLKKTSGTMWAELAASAIPVLTKVVDAVQPVVTSITEWIKANPTLAQGVAMGAFAVGSFLSVVGPLVLMLPTLNTAFGIMSGWLGAGGIAGAATTATTALAGMAPGMAALAASAAPILLVAAAVAGLAYELYKLKQAYNEAAAAGEQLIQTQQREYAMRAEYGRRTGTEAEMAAQQREIDNATPTLGERFQGWVTGGGVTGQTLAQTRVSAGQSIPRRRATGGPVTPGIGYLVGENEAEMFFPDLPGEIRNRAQTESLMATYEKFNAMTAPSMRDQQLFAELEERRKVFNKSNERKNAVAPAVFPSMSNAFPAGAGAMETTQSRQPGSGQQVVVNINGPVYGADGIKEIAQEEIARAIRAQGYEGRAISYA